MLLARLHRRSRMRASSAAINPSLGAITAICTIRLSDQINRPYVKDMSQIQSPLARAEAFCQRFGLRLPVAMAPMAGACPPSLAAAVANAGGLGACGALMMQPAQILDWAGKVRAQSNGGFQMNLWIPDPPPRRDPALESAVRAFLAQWGPAVDAAAGDAALPDFAAQCEAMIEAGPAIVSSIMGLYPAEYVRRLKERGISWWATVSTVTEAREAEAAGADVIVAQGMEAGGHRGAFDATQAEARLVGLFALLPAVVDAVELPVVATGGIANARGAAAALVLGASAVQIGTGLLRSPEAKLHPAWAEALARTPPEGTMVSRVFSGRPGRSVATSYARAATAPDAPPPAPYPVQRGLTQAMRDAAGKAGDVERMQAWAGQSAMLARAAPAAEIVRDMWEGAREVLR
jgi:nitronate monooxygenase